MELPQGFQFSQSSLQDFADCRRRFQLRYLLRVAWPAVESEPYLENERYLEQGQRFHQMAHQYFLGLPAGRLSSLLVAAELGGWWENFLRLVQDNPDFSPSAGVRLYPEASLSAALPLPLEPPGAAGEAAWRLIARYDLIAFAADGTATIFDWKTNRYRPRRAWLEKRVQSRVYPYLLVRAGAHLNGGQPVQPDQVQMVYWFSAFPNRPERFAYSAARYAEDERYLLDQVTTIRHLGDDQFPLTDQVRRCATCLYRSLCERGVAAGDLAESEAFTEGEDWDLLPDLDQIAEIAF